MLAVPPEGGILKAQALSISLSHFAAGTGGHARSAQCPPDQTRALSLAPEKGAECGKQRDLGVRGRGRSERPPEAGWSASGAAAATAAAFAAAAAVRPDIVWFNSI